MPERLYKTEAAAIQAMKLIGLRWRTAQLFEEEHE